MLEKYLDHPTHVIGIDPSLGKLGISLYCLTSEKTEWAAQLNQSFAGPDWQLRAMRMVNAVMGTLMVASVNIGFQVDKPGVWLVCETPDNWFTDKGMDSKNAGDIQKLYWFVGALLGAIQHRAGGIDLQEIWTTIPKAWKGQTPKRIMIDRAMEQLEKCGISPEKTIPDDAGEAVLLARIAGEKFRTKVQEGKGWVRIWSRSWEAMGDVVKIRMWSPKSD